MSCTDLPELPEVCLTRILSLISPGDILRSSIVCKQLMLASESDVVWEKFVPSDCDDIICQSSTPLLQKFTSKKNLFLYLCSSPILLNTHTQSFGLDKCSGKKCYMLGARALVIEWGDTPQYWTWKSVPESRFPEVAELQDVCWLELKGKIQTKLLTPNTTYGAYFVFKIDINNCRSFENVAVNVFVTEVDEEGLPKNRNQAVVVNQFYLKAAEAGRRKRRPRKPKELPVERDDGWMEVEMGRYYVNGVNEGVLLEMTLKEIEDGHWKSGLLVQGMEVRPLD